MKPFQVNCSELIADFAIHKDEDIRELITFLADEFDIEIYLEFFQTRNSFFRFNTSVKFNIEIDSIPFVIVIEPGEYSEIWRANVINNNDMVKLIDSIEKYTIIRHGEEKIEASSLLARELRKKIIMLNPNYHTKIENKLCTITNIDEIIKTNVRLGSGTNLTTLRFGSNSYADELGWYFDSGGHTDSRNYPFFEWAKNECKAKIRAFDGGYTFEYNKFLENIDRERLRKKS